MSLTLNHVLSSKGRAVRTIPPTATLAEVAETLVRHNIGSLVVCEPGVEDDEPRMVGIITERDVLRATAASGPAFGGRLVDEVMTCAVITGEPADTLERIMGQMTHHRVRHLPVVSGGRLCGLVSIGDVVKALLDQMALENQYLKEYIQG